MPDAVRLPEMKQHATGVWFIYWGRRQYYFSKDKAASLVAYHKHLRDVYLPAMEAINLSRAERERRRGRSVLIVDLAEDWLRALSDGQRQRITVTDHRYRLRALLAALGTMPAARFHVSILRGIQADLSANYAPTTVRHSIVSIRAMFRWGAAEGIVPPIDLSGVRPPRQPRPTPTIFTIRQIVQLIERACDQASHSSSVKHHGPAIAADLRHWLSLHYLAALRTSEVGRLVRREGKWALPPDGSGGAGQGAVFVLERSKTMGVSGQGRHVVLSAEALTHLEASHPRWKLPNSYAQAVGRALGPAGWPHPLRHSAATHLEERGAREEDIARLLGHGTPGALQNYLRVARQRLLPAAGLLTLRLVGGGSSAPSGGDPEEELAGPS